LEVLFGRLAALVFAPREQSFEVLVWHAVVGEYQKCVLCRVLSNWAARFVMHVIVRIASSFIKEPDVGLISQARMTSEFLI
jgi:hypothetical protein